MDRLRLNALAMVGGALIAAGLDTPGGRRLVQLRIDEEQAEISLQCLVPPDRFPAMLTEVEHRATAFRRWNDAQPIPGPAAHETARAAALRSVAADVARGWLG